MDINNERIYLLGSIDKKYKDKYFLRNIHSYNIDNEMRLRVLNNDTITYLFDDIIYSNDNKIILYNKFFYINNYYDDYDKLVSYMLENKINKMEISTVSFLLKNDEINQKVSYVYNSQLGCFYLSDIIYLKRNNISFSFADIFKPIQNKRNLFSKNFNLKDIKRLLAKEDVCVFDSIDYVLYSFFRKKGNNNMKEISYDIIEKYIKNNTKSELFF